MDVLKLVKDCKTMDVLKFVKDMNLEDLVDFNKSIEKYAWDKYEQLKNEQESKIKSLLKGSRYDEFFICKNSISIKTKISMCETYDDEKYFVYISCQITKEKLRVRYKVLCNCMSSRFCHGCKAREFNDTLPPIATFFYEGGNKKITKLCGKECEKYFSNEDLEIWENLWVNFDKYHSYVERPTFCKKCGY